jgi:hypothetical protein
MALRELKEEVGSAARRRGTERAETHEGFEYDGVLGQNRFSKYATVRELIGSVNTSASQDLSGLISPDAIVQKRTYVRSHSAGPQTTHVQRLGVQRYAAAWML